MLPHAEANLPDRKLHSGGLVTERKLAIALKQPQ